MATNQDLGVPLPKINVSEPKVKTPSLEELETMKNRELMDWCERLEIEGWEDFTDRKHYVSGLLEKIKKVQGCKSKPAVGISIYFYFKSVSKSCCLLSTAKVVESLAFTS